MASTSDLTDRSEMPLREMVLALDLWFLFDIVFLFPGKLGRLAVAGDSESVGKRGFTSVAKRR